MTTLGNSALKQSEEQSYHTVDKTRFLANHILFPPKLPQSLEEDGQNGWADIFDFVADAAKAFVENCKPSEPNLNCLKKFLEHTDRCHGVTRLNSDSVAKTIEALDVKESVLLYIGAQNAAVIIQRPSDDELVFELFELSPRNSSILATEGALERSFPGVAVCVARGRVNEYRFPRYLTRCLGDFSSQIVEEFQPLDEEAEDGTVDARDTTNPALITDMLASLLISIGEEYSDSKTIKRTREDVCGVNDCVPWRRQPFWLALRVGLQRTLIAQMGQEKGLKIHKNFLTFLVAKLCDRIGAADLDLASHAKAKLMRRIEKLTKRGQTIISLEPFFRGVLFRTNEYLEENWRNIRALYCRTISKIGGCRVTDALETLKTLEFPSDILVEQDSEGVLIAKIPRLELTFRVKQDQPLECVELNARVSETQDLGTLYGFESFLLLDYIPTKSKLVIVPRGAVTYTARYDHVSVSIIPGTSDRFPYACLMINPYVGCLELAYDEQDVLLLAYLHALTSHVLADPLTKRTGTEESLRILRAFGSQPHQPLDDASCDMIQKISELTPRRTFYPANLKIMQRVEWDKSLRASSQHDDFRVAAEDLIDHCKKKSAVSSSPQSDVEEDSSEEVLYARARFRNQTYRRDTEQYVPQSPPADERYQSRDICTKNKSCQRVYEVVKLIDTWDKCIDVEPDIGISMEEHGIIRDFNRYVKIDYATELLDVDLGSLWGPLYVKCREAEEYRDRAEFVFLFGILAFARDADLPLLKALLAVAFNLAAQAPAPPEGDGVADFKFWYAPPNSLFREAFSKHDRMPDPPKGTSDESHLPLERQKLRQEARVRMHEKQLQHSVSNAARHLAEQWPQDSPSAFESLYGRINVAAVIELLRDDWHSWYRDWLLSRFFDELQMSLANISSQAPLDWPEPTEMED